MSQQSNIEWTDATWNPVRGCVKVSPGCAHCYAETFAERFRGVNGHPYEQGFDLRLVPEKLSEPLSWKKPRRVFVNSMSDLFQDGVPDKYIEQVFSVMALAEKHTFQVLTKRPDRMLAWFKARRFDVKGSAILQTELAGECLYAFPWPLPNVWLGVSVENQHFADERIPLLLHTPAAVRFISAEPLLGPIRLKQQNPDGFWPPAAPQPDVAWLRHKDWPDDFQYWSTGLQWVIVGGESGPGARPFNIAWGRSIVEQCRAAAVPVFVKQLGAKPFEPYSDGTPFVDLHLVSKKGGDLTEWPEDLRVREFPT